MVSVSGETQAAAIPHDEASIPGGLIHSARRGSLSQPGQRQLGHGDGRHCHWLQELLAPAPKWA
jgi:hypothetical protein